MTIIEAINSIDSLRHNTYSQSDKVKWLSQIDGIIKHEIIDTHEGASEVTYDGYNAETDLDTELLAPAPYDEVYIRWLEMQMDYHNGEYNKYNNSMAMYQAAYTAFERYYNRVHKPLGKSLKFF